ncbi:MAG: hypothetical protein QXT45_03380 [Candidatus Bilamarchaeaceae archaeon]
MSMGSIGHIFSQVSAVVKHVLGLAPASRAAGTYNGQVINRSAYGDLAVVVLTGATSGSPTSFSVTVKVQHGSNSDGSDMTDFTTDTVVVNATNSIAVLPVRLVGAKEFVRAVAQTTFTGGTAPEVQCACVMAFGDAGKLPV